MKGGAGDNVGIAPVMTEPGSPARVGRTGEIASAGALAALFGSQAGSRH